MKKALRYAGYIILIIVIVVAGLGIYVKKALPNLGPVPQITVNINPERIARGNYLANHVAACMDCHSQRDWSLYSGPVKKAGFGGGGERFGKEVGFPGTLYSRNITPFALKGWTDGDLFRAITEGVSKDGRALFPVMNYPAYAKMDTEDIYSIIAYLRNIPSVDNQVPDGSLDFPMNFIVNTIPKKYEPVSKPDTNNQLAYGKYLADVASCVECHSQTDKGKIVPGTEFGGGRIFQFPNGTVAVSSNISPDTETGIGSWNTELFVQKFKQYRDSAFSHRPVAEAGQNTIMPWTLYAGLQEKDLSALFTYLKTVKPVHNLVSKARMAKR